MAPRRRAAACGVSWRMWCSRDGKFSPGKRSSICWMIICIMDTSSLSPPSPGSWLMQKPEAGKDLWTRNTETAAFITTTGQTINAAQLWMSKTRRRSLWWKNSARHSMNGFAHRILLQDGDYNPAISANTPFHRILKPLFYSWLAFQRRSLRMSRCMYCEDGMESKE